MMLLNIPSELKLLFLQVWVALTDCCGKCWLYSLRTKEYCLVLSYLALPLCKLCLSSANCAYGSSFHTRRGPAHFLSAAEASRPRSDVAKRNTIVLVLQIAEFQVQNVLSDLGLLVKLQTLSPSEVESCTWSMKLPSSHALMKSFQA